MIRVTVDTNIFDADKQAALKEMASGLEVEFAFVTVSGREVRGTDIAPPSPIEIQESGVWGESEWGQFIWADEPGLESQVSDESFAGSAVAGSSKGASVLESVLRLISHGAFPPPDQRSNLTRGQRRQLRDAMIFQAHVRDHRDVFLTDDRKAFLGRDGGVRRSLEDAFGTKILTLSEFEGFCKVYKAHRATDGSLT